MKKINEFIDIKNILTDKKLLSNIKSGLYLEDDVWMFPEESYVIFLTECGHDVPKDFLPVAYKITEKMNEYNVDPNDWEDSFNKIVEELKNERI